MDSALIRDTNDSSHTLEFATRPPRIRAFGHDPVAVSRWEVMHKLRVETRQSIAGTQREEVTGSGSD